MPKHRFEAGRKPYTIAMVGTNDAEINMYGEVVQTQPIDWWTGEPEPGNFICVDKFLADLADLSTKDNITIHLNSIGGDFYAGLSIYNRLRSMRASITTINDSLAASAGSIIFMAGDKGKRKCYAGSNLMVHSVLGYTRGGYYNALDHETKAAELRSHNKAAIAAYMEATGLDEDTVTAAMDKDTYMTGQEAVDAGWADEVISGEGETLHMKLSPDKSRLMFRGNAVAACLFGKIPDSIQQMTEAEYAAFAADTSETAPAMTGGKNNSKNGGNVRMEIKNVDELRNAFPEFVQQIENSARAAGATAERQRIQGIESIENAVGDAEMIRNAKYGEHPMNAQELAFAAMQKQAKIGANMLDGMAADAAASGAANVTASPAAGKEEAPDGPKAMADQAAKDVEMFQNMKNKEVF